MAFRRLMFELFALRIAVFVFVYTQNIFDLNLIITEINLLRDIDIILCYQSTELISMVHYYAVNFYECLKFLRLTKVQ